jgi:hypothetical protein
VIEVILFTVQTPHISVFQYLASMAAKSKYSISLRRSRCTWKYTGQLSAISRNRKGNASGMAELETDGVTIQKSSSIPSVQMLDVLDFSCVKFVS